MKINQVKRGKKRKPARAEGYGKKKAAIEKPGQKKLKPVRFETPDEETFFNAFRQSYQDLAFLREMHAAISKQYAGDMYGRDHQTGYLSEHELNSDDIPENLIHQFISTYMHLLGSGDMKSLITPKRRELRPFARGLEAALNRWLKEIDLGRERTMFIYGALTSLGVMKVGYTRTGEYVEGADGGYYKAKLFAASVVAEDFVIDRQAKRIEDVEFIGDRTLMPKEWIEETRSGREKPTPQRGQAHTSTEYTRISGVVERSGLHITDQDYVWFVYFPKTNLYGYFVEGEDRFLCPLAEWIGPEHGPYHILDFRPVLGEVFGPSPASILYRGHMHINNAKRKIMRQANAQKDLWFSAGGESSKLAEEIISASDGDAFAIPPGSEVRKESSGGPNPAIQNHIISLRRDFDRAAGNLSILGGLAPQSETKGQDEMLAQSAGIGVSEMQRRFMGAMIGVVRDVLWYLYFDQVEDETVELQITDEISIPVTISPDEREGDFTDYEVDVDLNTLAFKSPQERYAELVEFLQTAVTPNIELLVQQQIAPNMEEILRRLAKYRGLEFDDLFVPMDDKEVEEFRNHLPSRPYGGDRRTVHERISRPGSTAGSIDTNMMAANASLAQSGGS